MQIVIATGNSGKFREISQIIALPSLEFLSLADLPDAPAVDEAGETFEDNALLKARSAAYRAGGWALADDSGLVIPALGGRPGVRSARFAGDGASDADNVKKVLALMQDVPDDRQAEFVCCIAVAGANNRAYFTEGRLKGMIAREPRGSNGFGYDPIFLLPDLDKTMAELAPGEKNALSHRTIALRKIVPLLRSLAEGTTAIC